MNLPIKKLCILLICTLLILTITPTNATTPTTDEQELPTQALAKLTYPLHSIPALTEANQALDITIQTTATITDAALQLETAYEPVVNTYTIAPTSINQNADTATLTIIIPEEAQPELYNLTATLTTASGELQVHQPRCINIYEDINDTFTFIHITDFHVGDFRGLPENPHETLKHRNIKKCIEEINLLHPDFVIISGDLVFGQIHPFDYLYEYPLCYNMLQQIDVPTFLVPGNHDGYHHIVLDGLDLWNDYFGPHYHSFNYGDYHFIGLNSYDWPVFNRLTFFVLPFGWGGSIQDQQLQWLEDDLSSHGDSEKTFIYLHHNPMYETISENLFKWPYHNRYPLLDLIDEYDVDMVLGGHVHWDAVEIENDTIFLTTTTPRSGVGEDAYWGYRLIEIQDGEISRYNYKEPHYSIPSYRLNITQTTTEHSATFSLQNDLDQDLHVQLEATLPLGSYSTDIGTITQTRNDSTSSQLYISLTLPAQTTTEVHIS